METAVKPVKETIAVRSLPEGTKAKLNELAETHGRSFEAEARHAIKQHLASNAGADQAVLGEDNHSNLATYEAELHVSQVTAKRDSVKRKLDGGSTVVTSSDLHRLEMDLTDARLKLGAVSPSHPQSLLHAMQP